MTALNTLKRFAMPWLAAVAFSFSGAALAAGDHDHHHKHAEERIFEGVSVQLWSVKDDVSDDVKGTLKQLADWGFDGVELAGNLGEFGDDAQAFKAYLDSLGLEVSGAHVGFDQLTDEKFDATVQFYKTLGVNWLIVPADGRAWNDDGIEDIVADLNAMAERLAPHGMQIGYHNHQDEFNTYKDSTYWEYMADNTADNVIMQLDISWAYFAGMDPAKLIRQYESRVRTAHIKAQVTHYKDAMPAIEKANPEGWGEKMGLVFAELNKVTAADNGVTSIVGQDLVDWSAVIEAFKDTSKSTWLVVEQEVYPEGMTPMEAVKASKDGLMDVL
ncbi:sugar phosphate isomerase/epimerase family protein [Gilvimarinus xylanilyticus]|uniref:Sugar phosphate isomerase/epimerase n=1 Tax=Gilvimarinus xylanilyticus TaxID=2944139 RepID=A0A9X2HYZ4_9GAMM|nr:sugar phosphate isomerase/epimerase [Gilvimarinus xylanilyticus]MCP8899086.1 sugar phosphate isomerase/epimerase [Gilvimarinus xylanilyticus]